MKQLTHSEYDALERAVIDGTRLAIYRRGTEYVVIPQALRLREIQSGQFAREWILENKAGAPAFKAVRRRERNHPIEEVGKRLRGLMSWINAKEV